MSAETTTVPRVRLRWRVMPAVLVSLVTGLGIAGPVPLTTADAASVGNSSVPAAGLAGTFTVDVANERFATVTPITTATNTAGPPIPVGHQPNSFVITPDGKTAYVANEQSGTVTPIATATNTAGRPIPVGIAPGAIAVTPAAVTPGAGPIVSAHRKSKCVDDSHDSSANDTKIVMWDCNRSAEQNWAIEADGTIQINGKCMDINRDEKSNKAPVEMWTCTGGANQQWHAVNGTLVNPVSAKCLDDPRFNTADGIQLEIYTCNGGANQQWILP